MGEEVTKSAQKVKIKFPTQYKFQFLMGKNKGGRFLKMLFF